MQPASYYKTRENRSVQCLLCPHLCILDPDQYGKCNTRVNRKGELITDKDLIEALDKINYTLKARDIVLIRTDCSQHFEEEQYQYLHPGMSREGTLWLIDQGIRVMGTDAWGWDASLDVLVAEFKKGIKGRLWAAHYAGREREYCLSSNCPTL